jgi:molybdopterin-guanine dinucleotide biosynthesis protein A
MMDRQWTGVVLAGGKSSRMGRDKALIELDGITLLDQTIEHLRPHCREILVIGDPAKYDPLHATVVPDDKPGLGPLGGVVTALNHARYVRILVLACDLPNINDRLLYLLKAELIGDRDAVVPDHGGMLEPLSAAYHLRAIEAFSIQLDKGDLKMSTALDAVRTAYLPIDPGENGWPPNLFRNINAPTDL